MYDSLMWFKQQRKKNAVMSIEEKIIKQRTTLFKVTYWKFDLNCDLIDLSFSEITQYLDGSSAFCFCNFSRNLLDK